MTTIKQKWKLKPEEHSTRSHVIHDRQVMLYMIDKILEVTCGF